MNLPNTLFMGFFRVFEYDAKNNQTGFKRKAGASGTAYYISATDFDDKRHPVAEHHYPSKTSNRDVAERSTTRFEYSFWDAKQKVIKTRKTIRPAIPETQNGTGETSVTAPLGRITNYEYDRQGRRIKTILPSPASGVARSVQQVEYDLLGRIVKTIDPLGNVSKTIYNELGQIIKRIDANGGETQYHYDHLGQLLSLTDPVGNTTSYEYDSQGHVVKETNPLNKSRYFEYIGQLLIRKTDRNSRITEYVYDRFGRQKEERWLEGKKVIKTIINTYNEIGDLINVNDGLNLFEYEFNALRQETQSVAKFDGLNKETKLKSAYDQRGQRILSESGNFSTQYTYTPNRLVESIVQGDKFVQYSYDLTGQRISAKTPAVTTTYNYDGAGRLTKIDHQNIAHYDYQWDSDY